MPKVRLGPRVIDCQVGDNLRKVLMKARLPRYHPLSRIFHCRGLGTCGTCAVKLRGSASWPTRVENIRMAVPPHTAEGGLRLACQCHVEGDLVVEKFKGVWGEKLSQHVPVAGGPENTADLNDAHETAANLTKEDDQNAELLKSEIAADVRPLRSFERQWPDVSLTNDRAPVRAVNPAIESAAVMLMLKRKVRRRKVSSRSEGRPELVRRIASGETPQTHRRRYLRRRYGL